jgi:hypothetical protein
MEEPDVAQPAIVFWMDRPGEITRFHRLSEAIRSVMQTPSANTAPIAWIRTLHGHLEMDEIRHISNRFSLTWRLSQVAEEVGKAAESVGAMEPPRRKPLHWPRLRELSLLGSPRRSTAALFASWARSPKREPPEITP